MKVVIVCDSEQKLGGGFSFRRNLIKGLGESGVEVVGTIEEADIVLVPAPTMITRETFVKAKDLGKRIVLRLDNVPRNSRNRNTGTTRLLEFARASDAVVYQSMWARHFLEPYTGREGPIIYNGVDTDVFTKYGDKYDWGSPVYLYSRFNRDETKRWEQAWYEYQMIQRNEKAKLILVGNFSQEQIEYNFDFFMDEDFQYLGIVDNQEEMAKIYRSCQYLFATYYNDCYSNTYQEALACGCELYNPSMTGGTPELIKNGPISLSKMAKDYIELFESLLK